MGCDAEAGRLSTWEQKNHDDGVWYDECRTTASFQTCCTDNLMISTRCYERSRNKPKRRRKGHVLRAAALGLRAKGQHAPLMHTVDSNDEL